MRRILTRSLDRLVDDELRARHARLGLSLNAYGFDRFGASRDDQLRMLALMRYLHRGYFRVEASGLDRIPEGRVLLVGNHSGQLGYDALLITTTLFFDAEPPRLVRGMVESFFVETPFIGRLMTRMGQLSALPDNAERLLMEEDAAVLVFPEGERGGGRVWGNRYRIMGFSQGFVRLARRTRTPIVPFAFIGGEEMCPSVSRAEPLAKKLGVPYVPIVPWLIPLPAPVKVRIHFGAPMRFEGTGDEEDDVILPDVRSVEHAVAELIERGLSERRGVFT